MKHLTANKLNLSKMRKVNDPLTQFFINVVSGFFCAGFIAIIVKINWSSPGRFEFIVTTFLVALIVLSLTIAIALRLHIRKTELLRKTIESQCKMIESLRKTIESHENQMKENEEQAGMRRTREILQRQKMQSS